MLKLQSFSFPPCCLCSSDSTEMPTTYLLISSAVKMWFRPWKDLGLPCLMSTVSTLFLDSQSTLTSAFYCIVACFFFWKTFWWVRLLQFPFCVPEAISPPSTRRNPRATWRHRCTGRLMKSLSNMSRSFHVSAPLWYRWRRCRDCLNLDLHVWISFSKHFQILIPMAQCTNFLHGALGAILCSQPTFYNQAKLQLVHNLWWLHQFLWILEF